MQLKIIANNIIIFIFLVNHFEELVSLFLIFVFIFSFK